MKYLPTAEMIANGLRKSLPKTQYQIFTKNFNLVIDI